MANNTNQVAKTLGEQMADLLRRKPKNFDVTFSVGPDKIKVEAVRFILKAASPVFEQEFEEKWENGVGTDDNGIPMPNEDPTAFQLFVNLLFLDAWSLDSLKSLNLSPNNLLNLLGLCRQYEITKAIRNLEKLADDFIQSFEKYKDTAQFLEISRENLEMIFYSENIPLNETQIFEYACRWASNQCTMEGLKPTGENYSEVLGTCLYQIRFPTMTTEEFTKISLFKKNVLKAEEKLAVYEYIGLDSDEKFQVNEKILLHGFGFMGPIDEDASIDVTVQILDKNWPSYKVDYKPILVNASSYDSHWRNFHVINFSLKGLSNNALYKVKNPQHDCVETSGVKFHLHRDWNNGNPLAELLFKKL